MVDYNDGQMMTPIVIDCVTLVFCFHICRVQA